MSLESTARSVIVQPPRHKVHRQKPAVQFPASGAKEAAQHLAALIQRTKAHHQVGSFLYVEPAAEQAEPNVFNAYVIAETQGCAADWLLTRVRFLVGLYLPVRGSLSASAEDIHEDIGQHLEDLQVGAPL